MKRFTLSLVTLLTAVACLAQRQPSASALAGPFEVSGTVVHSVTGQPLAGVTVTLSLSPNSEPLRVFNTAPRYLPEKPPDIHPVTTSADGKFRFTGLAEGRYSLLAVKRAFSP